MQISTPTLYFSLLLLLSPLTLSLPIPGFPTEEILSTSTSIDPLFPAWELPSGWLGFRVITPPSSSHHTYPTLPPTYNLDGHLVNSPIRGVVTDSSAKLRLGITAKELDDLFEHRILNRPRKKSLVKNGGSGNQVARSHRNSKA